MRLYYPILVYPFESGRAYERFSYSDRWINWNDVERCPYTPKEEAYFQWVEEDNKRLELCALWNYGEYLKIRDPI